MSEDEAPKGPAERSVDYARYNAVRDDDETVVGRTDDGHLLVESAGGNEANSPTKTADNKIRHFQGIRQLGNLARIPQAGFELVTFRPGKAARTMGEFFASTGDRIADTVHNTRVRAQRGADRLKQMVNRAK